MKKSNYNSTGNIELINWNLLEKFMKSLEKSYALLKSPFSSDYKDSNKFVTEYLNSLTNYKNTKNKEEIQTSFTKLIEEWPIYLFFQNEKKDDASLKKFLYIANHFF